MGFMVGYCSKGLDLMAQELPCEAVEGAGRTNLWLTQMLISSSSDIEGDELPGNLIFVAIKVSQLWVDSKTAFPLPMLHLLWIFGLWLYTNLSCNSFTLYH